MRLPNSIAAQASCALLLATAGAARGGKQASPVRHSGRSAVAGAAGRCDQDRTQLIAPDELVQPLRSPRLSGRYTTEEAVARLLAGTDLRYRLVDGTMVVERAAAHPDEGRNIVVAGTNLRFAQPTSPVLTITRRDLVLDRAAQLFAARARDAEPPLLPGNNPGR